MSKVKRKYKCTMKVMRFLHAQIDYLEYQNNLLNDN